MRLNLHNLIEGMPPRGQRPHGKASIALGVTVASLIFLGGCEPGLAPGEVGTATCLACHDGRNGSDHAAFMTGPHQSVSCETCHGPGLRHVRDGGRLGLFINNPGDLPQERRHEACTPCHDQAASPGGSAVAGFLATTHFTSGAATCTDCHNVHLPGGMSVPVSSPARMTAEHFEAVCGACHQDTVAQFALSGHAASEVATCASCHDMHAGGMVTAEPEDNRMCLQCHQSFALGFETDEDVALHTGHPVDPAGSGASRCTGCHMPPVEAGAGALHDHSLLTIPPLASNEAMAQGIHPAPPNSCAGVAGCHDATMPGSGPAFDENDAESNTDLQALYELMGVAP